MTFYSACVVFAIAVLYDVLFAYYVRFNTAKRALPAALASSATYLVGVIGLLAVTRLSPWFVIPEMLGLGVGSFLGVKRANRDFPTARVIE